MPLTVIALMMGAATLSATWNALIKGAGNKLFMTILLLGAAGLLGALALPFLPRAAPASWPYIAASAALSVAYYALVVQAYHLADLSLAFPVMRGTAPLLVALASRMVIGERLSWGAWLGVGLICSGILGLAATARGGSARGVGLALANAVNIAVYTCVDGLGVRRSASPVAYGLWVYLLTSAPMVAWACLRHKAEFARYAVKWLPLGLLGGVAGIAIYSTTLWGMTVAPVALVAISAIFLKERVGVRRAVLACVIAFGAVVLRLA